MTRPIKHDPLKVACIRLLRDAKNCDIHIGNERANMLRRALGLPEVAYSRSYKRLLEQKTPLLGAR